MPMLSSAGPLAESLITILEILETYSLCGESRTYKADGNPKKVCRLHFIEGDEPGLLSPLFLGLHTLGKFIFQVRERFMMIFQ